MCYSAQITADYRRYVRDYGAQIDLAAFYDLFWRRARDAFKPKVPKAMEEWFRALDGDQARDIWALIEEHRAAEATRLEQELFKQRKRLAGAERSLQARTSKTAVDSKRIATDKIAWAQGKLAGLRGPGLGPDDARIFPGHYAPVMVMEHGCRVIKPMRYQCRPAGKPAAHDIQFPGTYNARRDSLPGYWKGLFGRTHGILLAETFFENVQQGGTNVVLEFRPRPANEVLVACLWSRWSAPGEPDLLSFAAITDEPPQEVAAAGHDRCIIAIDACSIGEWLDPHPAQLERSQAVLDGRLPVYFEHRLAA